MNLEELTEIREKETARQAKLEKRILYCSAAGCVSCGGNRTRDALKAALKGQAGTEVVGTGCMGLCGKGPLVKVAPDETLYATVVCDGAPPCRDGYTCRAAGAHKVCLPR